MRTHRRIPQPGPAQRGFTLTELIISLTFLALVLVTLATVMFSAARSKGTSANSVESVQAARVAMEMMAKDIRSAGYNTDLYQAMPQQPFAYVDSLEIIINENLYPYNNPSATLEPQAYSPTASPRPVTLDGTAWQPTMKYTTGAEAIRYTLDVNNDGAVDSLDWSDPNGADAQRSQNPRDYVLVRQIYGDNTGGTIGNNGGQTERIALVQRPGAGVAPLFTVYMKGSSTPWDWSSGPVPAAQLGNIERVEIRVTAASSKKDWMNRYATTELRTVVNSLRNTPDTGQDLYAVSGTVFDDRDTSHDFTAGDAGLGGAQVRLGKTYSTTTSASGSFNFLVPAGTYTLRHTPPAGFGVFTSPDSFVVTVPAAGAYAFADTARRGGWVVAWAYEDLDGDSTWDAGEPALSGVTMTLTPGGAMDHTNASGAARLFAQPGAYSVQATLPDTLVATNANPQSGTMFNGDSTVHRFGGHFAQQGTVAGRVFTDNNKNGVYDAGEPGVRNAWVGVSSDNGLTVAGYQYTDSLGQYAIKVAINDPPHTLAYSVSCIVPAGKYATTRTSYSPVWVQAGVTVSGFDFGISGYTTITLTANRVLSLASGDLIEKDWNGNQTQNARQDADIILGADAGATDNISVWWNRYDTSPVFSGAANYTRLAPNSVLALAVDTLDTTGNRKRLDVVSGLRYSSGKNFVVWYTQDNPNEGALPAAWTSALSYATNDLGEVRCVATLDCAGGARPDILVGTASPTSGYGTIEVWQNSDAATPTFSRQEIYPPAGGIPGGRMGEVNTMVLADLNNDGRKDLIVGTKTGTYTGDIMIFQNVSKTNGLRFVHQRTLNTPGMAITALAVLDVNGDGYMDIVAGTQLGTAIADLQYWRNKSSALPWDFALDRDIAAPGLVMSLATADMGGGPNRDLIVGYRQDVSSYAGGVRIFYTDSGTLPLTGTDPSPSATPLVNMVPALTVNNFDYGTKPSAPSPPYLSDFAAAVKVDATTGLLVIFIR